MEIGRSLFIFTTAGTLLITENPYFKWSWKGVDNMFRNILMIAIFCSCLIFGMEGNSHAGPQPGPSYFGETMNKHIEEVKRKNPGKYQEMMQRNGGKVSHCIDCHPEGSGENPPAKKVIGIDKKLRK
jgi:hypothetical protein